MSDTPLTPEQHAERLLGVLENDCWPRNVDYRKIIAEGFRAAILAEREAIAQQIDAWRSVRSDPYVTGALEALARAIRS